MSLAKSARIEVRVSPAEKDAWAEAAGGSRRVSEWLRSLANQAVPGRSTEYVEKTPALAAETLKGKQCARAHHHRPGAYCGSCREVSAK